MLEYEYVELSVFILNPWILLGLTGFLIQNILLSDVSMAILLVVLKIEIRELSENVLCEWQYTMNTKLY